MPDRPWRRVPGGVQVAVRVTPRGGQDAIDGAVVLADGRAVLKLRVRSAPENGAANDAVRRLVAAAAAQSPSAVRLQAGATSRLKTLSIDGDPAAIESALVRASGMETGS